MLVPFLMKLNQCDLNRAFHILNKKGVATNQIEDSWKRQIVKWVKDSENLEKERQINPNNNPKKNGGKVGSFLEQMAERNNTSNSPMKGVKEDKNSLHGNSFDNEYDQFNNVDNEYKNTRTKMRIKMEEDLRKKYPYIDPRNLEDIYVYNGIQLKAVPHKRRFKGFNWNRDSEQVRGVYKYQYPGDPIKRKTLTTFNAEEGR